MILKQDLSNNVHIVGLLQEVPINKSVFITELVILNAF